MILISKMSLDEQKNYLRIRDRQYYFDKELWTSMKSNFEMF